MQTSVFIRVCALAGALLALPGCHHRAVPAGVTATSPGIVVAQARLVLPAVKGNPGVAYFTLGNETNASPTLVGVDIVGAQQAQMHQTSGATMAALPQVRIDPGQRLIFGPSGKHVMAFGIAASLTPGGSSAITFHFQDGRTISAPLRIESPGSAGGGMAGMTMGGKP